MASSPDQTHHHRPICQYPHLWCARAVSPRSLLQSIPPRLRTGVVAPGFSEDRGLNRRGTFARREPQFNKDRRDRRGNGGRRTAKPPYAPGYMLFAPADLARAVLRPPKKPFWS
jgi:hypothetical protein